MSISALFQDVRDTGLAPVRRCLKRYITHGAHLVLSSRGRWQEVAAELGATREALCHVLSRRRAARIGG